MEGLGIGGGWGLGWNLVELKKLIHVTLLVFSPAFSPLPSLSLSGFLTL